MLNAKQCTRANRWGRRLAPPTPALGQWFPVRIPYSHVRAHARARVHTHMNVYFLARSLARDLSRVCALSLLPTSPPTPFSRSHSRCQSRSRALSLSCQTTPMHTAGGASLSSGLLHLDQNQTHTSVCNMSLGQVGLPRNAQHEWYAGSDDAAVRAAAAAGAEAGKWVVFKKGLCAGRWVQIRAVNASGRCLELEPAWADGQPPCRPSAAQGAASPTGTTYIIATAPWARPAMPPLDATSQPPQQVRAEVHELDPSAQAAAAAVERATASAEQQGIPAAVEAQEAAAGDAGWHYGVTYLATRKGQYSVVTSLVGAPGLMATYYSLPSKVGADALGAQTPTAASLYAGGPVSAQRWGAQWQHEQYAVDWSGSPDSGSTDGGKGLVPHSSLAAAGATGFGIRWTGFLRSDGPRMYALRVALGGARTGAGGPLSIGAGGERVKLWVDNSLVIDQVRRVAVGLGAV